MITKIDNKLKAIPIPVKMMQPGDTGYIVNNQNYINHLVLRTGTGLVSLSAPHITWSWSNLDEHPDFEIKLVDLEITVV